MRCIIIDIKFILDHAKRTTPYYMDSVMNYKSCDAYYDFPIISKKIINENYNNFISSYEKNQNYIINWTSGTNGMPMRVEWNFSDYQSSYFELWKLRKMWYGITPIHRCLTFHAVSTNDYDRDIIINKNVLSIKKDILFEKDNFDYIYLIKEFAPQWILASPSLISILIEKLDKNNMLFVLESLLYVEFNGENYNENIANYVKEKLDVKISNLYGAIEFNGIAYQCPMGSLHVLESNVYVENICETKLIITSKTNLHMPIIRYDIGDFGKVIDKGCCCGYKSRVIENLIGRESEVLEFENIRIPVSLFSRVVETLNKEFVIILNYDVEVFKKTNIIKFRLLVSKKHVKEVEIYTDSIIRNIKNQLIETGIDFYLNVFSEPTEFYKNKTKFKIINYYDV